MTWVQTLAAVVAGGVITTGGSVVLEGWRAHRERDAEKRARESARREVAAELWSVRIALRQIKEQEVDVTLSDRAPQPGLQPLFRIEDLERQRGASRGHELGQRERLAATPDRVTPLDLGSAGRRVPRIAMTWWRHGRRRRSVAEGA